MSSIYRAELQFGLALIGRIEQQGAWLRWRRDGQTGRIGCDMEGLHIEVADVPGTDRLYLLIADTDAKPLMRFDPIAFGRADRAYLEAKLAGIHAAGLTQLAEPSGLAQPLEAAEEAQLAQLLTRLRPTTRRDTRSPLFDRDWTATAARLSSYLPGARALPQRGVAQDGLDIGMLGTPA